MSAGYLEGIDLRQDWRDDALCAQIGADDDWWFPEQGASIKQAKAICAMCPSRADCLQYALDHREGFGIWGGLSTRERERIANPPPPTPIQTRVCMDCLKPFEVYPTPSGRNSMRTRCTDCVPTPQVRSQKGKAA